MDNLSIFLNLLELNKNNQNFDTELRILINSQIQNRQNRLTLNEVILIANMHDFGFFIEETIDDDEESVQDFVRRMDIDINILFTDFTNLIQDRNSHIRFTNNIINPTRQIIL